MQTGPEEIKRRELNSKKIPSIQVLRMDGRMSNAGQNVKFDFITIFYFYEMPAGVGCLFRFLAVL